MQPNDTVHFPDGRDFKYPIGLRFVTKPDGRILLQMALERAPHAPYDTMDEAIYESLEHSIRWINVPMHTTIPGDETASIEE